MFASQHSIVSGPIMPPKHGKAMGAGDVHTILLECNVPHNCQPRPLWHRQLTRYVLHIDIVSWDGSIMYVQIGNFWSIWHVRQIEANLSYFSPNTTWRLSFF